MSRKTSDNYQHHAVTHHTKGAADGELVTISIVDGLGQPIQLKKTHYVGGSQLKWLVSGFEEKDVLGRAVKTYLPQLQNNANNALSTTALSYMNPSDFSAPPLIKKYDAKNRPTKITQPGENNSTDIEYSIEGNRAVSETTNEEGQTLKTYTDIRGQQRKTVQNDQITTEFDYNTVGELIKVTNTNGYQTKYEYDLAGRRTAEKSPDRGLTEFTYDKAGHLIKKQTANLMQPGNNGSIEYKYHYDRLTHIIYPNHPENNVVYEYGTTADEDKNQTGRLRLQKDATGLQYFEYDDMGNVETNIRAVAVAGRTAYWFETQWEYDSWNRIKTITYPDNEEVSYHYDKAGQVRAVTSDMNLWDLISNLTYDEYGQRRTVVYGNDTKIQYKYDNRQRLKILTNSFPADGDIYKKYTYDPLSNIKEIATLDNNNLLGTPEAGGLAGPMKYEFTYDDFNRLKESGGFYVGPNDFPTEQHALLRQQYSLGMQYDEQHNITRKYQNHQQAEVSNLSAPSQLQRVNKTSYVLNYEDYGTAGMSSGDYSYVQPHAPRKIIETPLGVNDPNEIQTKVKEVNYDADGNMTTIKQKIKDPDNQLVEEEMTLRHYRWDEEDRLRAVDLMPDNNPKMPEISNYTYDADGERIVRYVPGRLDAFYSANQAGFSDRLERFIYPSGLLTVKTLPLKPGTDLTPRMNLTTYTKHYYIGSERIVSSLGRANDLGLFCKDFQIYGVDDYLNEMDSKTTQAGEVLNADYQYFEKLLNLSPPILYNNSVLGCSLVPDPENELNTYWFHPDHLGSSSYISNKDGAISQHLEYFPFGETLVEEHKNSNNSPYKFNAKELDDETGNYYYGARYLNPKFSIWLSVDPMAEERFGMSPYNYVQNNPLNRIDSDGALDAPIYDEDGNFLGTDNQGLQGKAIVMNKDNFTQGMSHEDALSHSLGAKGLNEGGLDKLLTHKAGLKDRPDWDGHLTFSEVTKWSNQGNGEPLFVDATKINLNAINVTKLKQDKDGYINFFPGSHPNTGLVYGTIKLNLLNENTGAVRLGGKNGLLDVHDFKNPVFKTINDFLSPGTPTDFNIYCAPCNTKIRTVAEVKEYWNQVYKVMGERPKY